MLSLLPTAVINSATGYSFTSINYDKIKDGSGKTYTYLPVKGYRANALDKTGKAVWDRNQAEQDHTDASKAWEDAKRRGENPGNLPSELFFALFRNENWNRDTNSNYIRIPINEFLTAKKEGALAKSTKEGAVSLYHLNKQCFLFVCGYAPTQRTVIGTINAFKDAASYDFTWSYTKPPATDEAAMESFFRSNQPKLTSKCCGTLTYAKEPATFTGGGYTIVANLNDPAALPGATNLGSFYFGAKHLPTEGTLTTKDGSKVKVTLSDSSAPKPSSGKVNILLYVIDKSTLLGNAKDFLGSESYAMIELEGTTGKGAPGLVNIAASAVSFDNVSDGKYKATVRIPINSGFSAWAERIKAGAVGGDIKTIEGSVNLEMKGGKAVPVDAAILLQPSSVTVDGVLDDLFNTAMTNAVKWAINAINQAISGLMLVVSEAIEGGDEINQLESLKAVWTDIKNFSLSLLTIGIVIIAFANILQIDIQRWGIGRLIPRLVMALVMSYFSYLIIQFLLEFATAATKGIIATTGGGKTTISNLANKWPDIFPQAQIDAITGQGKFQGLFIILLLLGLLLTCLWLAIVLFVRKAVIMFLVAVAPLAFMMQVLPFTEKMYSQWWERFWKWVFMGPAIAFVLYLGTEFLVIGYTYQKLAPGSDFTGYGAINDAFLQTDAWIFLILTAVCWGMAAALPFTWGKEVFGQIQTGWKKYGGFIPGVKHGREWMKTATGYRDQRVKRQVQTAQKRVVQGIGPDGTKMQKRSAAVGRMLTGVDKRQAVNMPEKDIKREAFEKGDKALVNRYIKEHPGDVDAMIGAAKGGKLESDLAPLLEQLIATNREGTDELKKTISKEMPDYWAGAVNDGHGNQETVNKALESISKRKLEDLKGADLKFIHGQRGQQSGQRIIHEVVNNEGALKKILGQSQEVQAKWGQILQDSGHVRGANTEIDRLLDARDHFSATRPAGTAF